MMTTSSAAAMIGCLMRRRAGAGRAPANVGTTQRRREKLPLRRSLTLACEERRLARHSPAIAPKLAVAPHHAMTGDEHRNSVAGTGARHRARRRWAAQLRGNGLVAARCSLGDALKRTPHLPLKGGRADVQRKLAVVAC